jgi:ATP-binding cassette subfamily F protein 3
MIHLSGINLSFGAQVVFNDLSCTIKNTDRIGLVGNNGSGKSTLLRIIARQQLPDSGSVNILAHTTIGYMPQEITLTSEKAVIDEAITGCTVDEMDEPALRAEAKKILAGLGFKNEQFSQAVNTLSVGWRMRLLLCQLLLQKADFYLFDEPINHLDIVAQEWFLSFLKNAPFGFMLVCHDRYFLDQLCVSILELESGIGTRYRGNYSSYQEQKAARMATLHAQYENQQRDITRKQKTIDRFRAQASRARMVKKMERDLEKIERVVLPNTIKTIHFSFPAAPPAGKVILDVHNVGYTFGAKTIFKNVSFTIQRGERIAVVAANGVGKSTLFNVIAGIYPLQSGTISRGHNVERAYFQQDQLAVLDPEKTVFETIVQHAPMVKVQEVRDILGCFLFSNELSSKKYVY